MLEEWESHKWIPLIDVFLSIVHRKYGHFIHLPFSGGYYDQPYLTMTYLKIIQNEYFIFLEEINKKQINN